MLNLLPKLLVLTNLLSGLFWDILKSCDKFETTVFYFQAQRYITMPLVPYSQHFIFFVIYEWV
jgi:hypothetical protein